MKEYTKHKECTPEETIFRIRRLLREIGVFPVLKWTPDEFRGACSNRVYLDPVYGLGTNGKGTSEPYAEASAFAELAERLQNHLLHIKSFGPEESPWNISARYPDEKEMTFDELIDQGDAFLKQLFRKLGFVMRFQKITFLEKMAGMYGKTDGTIPVIPFTDVKEDRIIWLPNAVVVSFCGSNGMCAGNTMEEALVQGFSEILERHAQLRIIQEGLTPPEIPAKELEQYSLWPLIRQIEASGRYKVSIRDCSLGEGLPVTAVVIADRERNTFGVKFGCHPSFPVSVERTLTEALQGKRLELFTSLNAIGAEDQVLNYDNFANTAKTGEGFYPAAFLGADPSWEYAPWKEWESTGSQDAPATEAAEHEGSQKSTDRQEAPGTEAAELAGRQDAPATEPRRSSDNREYLKKILALLDRMGLVPLVRDASHLGFPTYFILVPGISEMFEMSSLRLRDLQTNAKVKKFFEHFPDLDEEEEELLLRLIQFKEGSIIENGLDLISGKFLKGELFTAERVGAYLALKKGKYTVAGYLFRKAFSVCQDKEDRKHLACMSEYARYMEGGAPRKDALAALTFLFGEDQANKAADETEDMATMMQKVFPRLRCYDCANCPLAGVHCEYPEAAVILRKINRALDQSTVTQEELLAKLRELV